jgi:hypothetical protein
MSNCTSGCFTQDHHSYAECLRSKNAGLSVVTPSAEYSQRNKWWTEVSEYRAARAQGIQPKSTQLSDIRSAVRRSELSNSAVQDL